MAGAPLLVGGARFFGAWAARFVVLLWKEMLCVCSVFVGWCAVCGVCIDIWIGAMNRFGLCVIGGCGWLGTIRVLALVGDVGLGWLGRFGWVLRVVVRGARPFRRGGFVRCGLVFFLEGDCYA